MLRRFALSISLLASGLAPLLVAARFAAQMYFLHEAFPDVIGTDYTLRGFDYVLGRHPAFNVSYVSAVGTNSKLIGYGNNRADYTFIPGEE